MFFDFFALKIRAESKASDEVFYGYVFGKTGEKIEYRFICLPRRFSKQVSVDLKSPLSTYKEFLNHQLSPGLLNYVQQRLRRLREINPKITMEPLRTRSHQYAPKQTRPARQTDICPTCYLEHVGECD